MLYDALAVLLVTEGPLESLYLGAQPPEQVHPVDVVMVPNSGVPPVRVFGSKPVKDGPDGVTHDGGVDQWHTGLLFQFRGADPDAAIPIFRTATAVRDVLAQYTGTEVTKAGETIVRCSVSSPYYYGQDDRERPVAGLRAEVWHRPV